MSSVDRGITMEGWRSDEGCAFPVVQAPSRPRPAILRCLFSYDFLPLLSPPCSLFLSLSLLSLSTSISVCAFPSWFPSPS